MKKNKEIISIGNQREFTVNHEKKTVSYKQNYKSDFNGVIVACSQAHKEDVFDVEYGKALAYAKADLKVREREYYRILGTRDTLDEYDMNDIFGNRIERKFYSTVVEELKAYKRYYNNQKRLVNELLKNEPNVSSLYTTETCGDWKNILKKVFEKVIKN